MNNKEFIWNKGAGKECPICGLSSFSHSHPANSKPNEFVMKWEGCNSDCPENGVCKNGMLHKTSYGEKSGKVTFSKPISNKEKCKSHPQCSHNTSDRSVDKPCSINFPTPSHSWEEELRKDFEEWCGEHKPFITLHTQIDLFRWWMIKLQEQKDEFLNQKANAHDQEVRKSVVDRIRKMVEGKIIKLLGENENDITIGLINASRRAYNQAINDIITDLEKENI